MASDWRSMDSAPKDGTRVLLYYRPELPSVKLAWSANRAGHFIRLARWDPNLRSWRLDMSGHWRTDPTHWMPLPSPPRSEGEG